MRLNNVVAMQEYRKLDQQGGWRGCREEVECSWLAEDLGWVRLGFRVKVSGSPCNRRRFARGKGPHSHLLKNKRTKRLMRLRQIAEQTTRRIAFVGTPVQKNLAECHTLIDLIAPGVISAEDR